MSTNEQQRLQAHRDDLLVETARLRARIAELERQLKTLSTETDRVMIGLAEQLTSAEERAAQAEKRIAESRKQEPQEMIDIAIREDYPK